MKRPAFAIAAALLAVLALASAVALPDLLADAGDRRTAEAEGPILWEYKTASLRFELQGKTIPIEGEGRYRQIEEELDKLGREGWLLTHAAGDFFVFRRPLVVKR